MTDKCFSGFRKSNGKSVSHSTYYNFILLPLLYEGHLSQVYHYRCSEPGGALCASCSFSFRLSSIRATGVVLPGR